MEVIRDFGSMNLDVSLSCFM